MDEEEATFPAIVELGCGTAQLSHHLQRALLLASRKTSFVLVDRQEFKRYRRKDEVMQKLYQPVKVEPTARRDPGIHDGKVTRLTMDLRDLNLGCVPDAQSPITHSLNLLCMSKHLCGPASDYSLRAIANAAQAAKQGESNSTSKPSLGVCIATCCHYLCTWEAFVGQDYFLQLGFSQADFSTVVACSHWATISVSVHVPPRDRQSHESHSREQASTPPTHSADCTTTTHATHSATVESNDHDENETKKKSRTSQAQVGTLVDIERLDTLSQAEQRVEKRRLGYLCKQILDTCRAEWLKTQGFDLQLKRYTSISKENMIIVAKLL